MQYFPIFLTAEKLNVMIVGGGDVAARKIELLLKTTKKITVMSAQLSPTVTRLVNEYQLQWLPHQYQSGLLVNKNLVIAATDDSAINKAVSEEASRLNLLINVVDQPKLCSYITPAIIDRSPMIIAMSSSGSAPILLRMLRERIEKTLPSNYGRLAEFSLKFREQVKIKIKSLRSRRAFWETTLRGAIGQTVLSGDAAKAEQQLLLSLNNKVTLPAGEIVFIHTKEGDPDNLTLKAHRELQYADAVFYDDEVNIQLIEYVRRDADKYPQSIPATVKVNYQHALALAENGQKVIYLLAGNEPLSKSSALQQSTIIKKSIICGA